MYQKTIRDHYDKIISDLTERAKTAEDARDTAIKELTEAIRYSVEYVGVRTLRPHPGWEWYDAMVKYAPEEAAKLRQSLRIQWSVIDRDWHLFWQEMIKGYSLPSNIEEQTKAFWDSRGGRDLYFNTTLGGEEVRNEYLA